MVDKQPEKVGEVGARGLSRIGSLGQVSGVLGCQWGDEGKGKLVDILAEHFDVVARCQVTYNRFFTLQSLFFWVMLLKLQEAFNFGYPFNYSNEG